jgi:hypothetical protein
VKRSEETVIIGNHQNAPREKKADKEVKDEQNRDENGKIEITENEIDKSDIVNSDQSDDTPLETEAMEKAVMDLAKVAEGADSESDDSNNSDIGEKVKVMEEEKQLEKLPKGAGVAEETEIEEDDVFGPQDIFNKLGAQENEVKDVNSDEVPDQESEVMDSSEEVSPEALLTANMEMAQERPVEEDYQYGRYLL